MLNYLLQVVLAVVLTFVLSLVFYIVMEYEVYKNRKSYYTGYANFLKIKFLAWCDLYK